MGEGSAIASGLPLGATPRDATHRSRYALRGGGGDRVGGEVGLSERPVSLSLSLSLSVQSIQRGLSE